MHIDLRQLRHFIALADQRSFVAGALAVNLSQSAFSRSIQALEHSVGCQLVDRGRKDLAPTKQGLVLLEHARRLVRVAQQMANEISQFNGLEAGELRFGCGPAPAAGLIPRAIGSFIGRYPKARVQFQVDDWQSLSKRLLSEEFEFFVADTRQFEADPGLPDPTPASTQMALLLPQRASVGRPGQRQRSGVDELPAGGEHPAAKSAQSHRRPQWPPGFHAECGVRKQRQPAERGGAFAGDWHCWRVLGCAA